MVLTCLPGSATAQVRAASPSAPAARTLPRTPDGKPNLQGIWQVRGRAAYDLADHAASLEPRGLELLVRNVREVEAAMGEEKIRVLKCEESARAKLRRPA